MKRPILIAAIGYIIGIIMGLYFKISIVFLYVIILAIVAIVKILNSKLKRKKQNFNMFAVSRYFRYMKLIFNSKILIVIAIFSIISNTIVIFKEYKYEKIYNDLKEVSFEGIIISEEKTSNYKNIYILDVQNYKNIKVYLKTNKNIHLKYGNKVKVEGNYQMPQIARNYGGFDYSKYLKQLGISGTVTARYTKVIYEEEIDKISLAIYNLQKKIKDNAKDNLNPEIYAIFSGLILGDKSNIDDNTEEAFSNSSMSHILAISGMHISYIIIGCSLIINKLLGKRKSKIITICVLLIYILIIGFSTSVVRATIMAIMILIGGLIHRKADIWTSISISILVILIYNPYLITNLGLQFSYISTLGIIILNRNLLRILKGDKKDKFKIRELLAVCLAAQIAILPISIFHFNTFGIYFIITNILVSIIIGPTIILCFIFFVLSIFNFEIIKFISVLIDIFIKIIISISKIGEFPLAKIYLGTPKIYQIIIYYILILLANFIYSLQSKKNPSTTNLRLRYMFQSFKFQFRKRGIKIKKVVICILFILSILVLTSIIIPKDLKIHFVDVGQGDCCFIETPQNKTILIDGGGSETSLYDVGKQVLLPYILDRGYTQIDYIIISHFDSDHVGGLFTIMEELNVKTVIISKQTKICDNYEKFKEIVNRKHIKVLIVGQGDTIGIEKDLSFFIIWPNKEKQVQENILNNNSIVCKLNYKEFSMLFTGDIEEVAEKEILNYYKNKTYILNSDILKVGHHGSKTSSIQEFLDVIKPKIALIGVGENNKFGHPNDQILKRLKNIGTHIYRTDEMGEISIDVNSKARIITVDQFISIDKK